MVFEFFSPGMPQIAKIAGAEFILFDMEHTAIDLDTVKRQVAYCRGISLPPYVRVPATDYHFIAHALDAGAMGVMVPMVETREQAEFIETRAGRSHGGADRELREVPGADTRGTGGLRQRSSV